MEASFGFQPPQRGWTIPEAIPDEDMWRPVVGIGQHLLQEELGSLVIARLRRILRLALSNWQSLESKMLIGAAFEVEGPIVYLRVQSGDVYSYFEYGYFEFAKEH